MKHAIVSYMHGSTEKQLAVLARSIKLTELYPGTEYEVSVMLVYKGERRSAPYSFVFTTAAATESQTAVVQTAITGGALGE